MAIDQEVGSAARAPEPRRRGFPGSGLIKGLGVTLKYLFQRSITQAYPHVKPDLPARTRGVIALKVENCTVCYKCSRECPDWCIYIDAHKETHEPAGGGRARSVKVLDRFAIDYSLCMYCGICVEVCPFDALFWSPEFEYAEYDLLEMTHEKERLEEWTYKVLPPPLLEEGAEPPEETGEQTPVATGGGEATSARAPSAGDISAPGAAPPQAGGGPPRGMPEVTSPATGAPPATPADSTATPSTEAQPAGTTAPAAQPAAAPAAPPAERHAEVEPDKETFDRVLAEELAKGTDKRVAEGRAKASAIRAARKKAAGG